LIASLQAVVFDFDGVIANSEPLHLRAFQMTLAALGGGLSADEYFARYLGFDDVGVFKEFGKDRGLGFSEDEVRRLVAEKAGHLQQLTSGDGVLFPGAKDFIRAAAAAVPVAIASGALRHEIEEVLEAAGLESFFPVIVASGDTPQSKPSPDPYDLAFRRLQGVAGKPLLRHRCVAIEDSRWGLESARGAGLRCVGVTSSYAAHELHGAELIAGGLNELTLEALDELCRRALP
jgi:HAD superfamily hydrolase (TIGR01509 family)